MGPQYACRNERRREAVLRHASLNGIDYLEVLDQEAPAGSPRQRTLLLRCLKALPPELGAANVHIAGGVRIAPVGVEWARPATEVGELLAEGLINQAEHDFFAALPELERLLLVRTNAAGDFSAYRLCLVQSPLSDTPREDFDPLLACVDVLLQGGLPRCPRLPGRADVSPRATARAADRLSGQGLHELPPPAPRPPGPDAARLAGTQPGGPGHRAG